MPSTKFKIRSLSLLIACASAGAVLPTSVALADAGNTKDYAMLQEDMPYLFVVHKGRSIKIVRSIAQSFRLPSNINNTLVNQAQHCPPFCLQPLKRDDLPVATISEVGVIDFMTNYLRNSTGVLIDVRSATQHKQFTIPGSVNYFVQTIQKGIGDNAFDAMFNALGVKPRGETSWLTRQMENVGLADTSEVTDTLDFTNAKDLVIWGDAQTDVNARYAIRSLLDAGYPAHKIRWYHGGIASWTFWGFTTYSEPKQY
jgi:rhodanese-related sulfurtransferase